MTNGDMAIISGFVNFLWFVIKHGSPWNFRHENPSTVHVFLGNCVKICEQWTTRLFYNMLAMPRGLCEIHDEIFGSQNQVLDEALWRKYQIWIELGCLANWRTSMKAYGGEPLWDSFHKRPMYNSPRGNLPRHKKGQWCSTNPALCCLLIEKQKIEGEYQYWWVVRRKKKKIIKWVVSCAKCNPWFLWCFRCYY